MPRRSGRSGRDSRKIAKHSSILSHVSQALLAELSGVAMADEEGELVEGFGGGGEVVAGFGF